jgi:hypothetical protein
LLWLEDPSDVNLDKLKNIRHKTSRNFGNENLEYLEDRINEPAMKRQSKNVTELHIHKRKMNLRIFPIYK